MNAHISHSPCGCKRIIRLKCDNYEHKAEYQDKMCGKHSFAVELFDIVEELAKQACPEEDYKYCTCFYCAAKKLVDKVNAVKVT